MTIKRRSMRVIVFVCLVLVLSSTISAYVANTYRGSVQLAASQSYAASAGYGGLIGKVTGYNNSGSAGDVKLTIEISSGSGWNAYQHVIIKPGYSGATNSWGSAPTNYLYRAILRPTTNPIFGNPGRIASGSVYTN